MSSKKKEKMTPDAVRRFIFNWGQDVRITHLSHQKILNSCTSGTNRDTRTKEPKELSQQPRCTSLMILSGQNWAFPLKATRPALADSLVEVLVVARAAVRRSSHGSFATVGI